MTTAPQVPAALCGLFPGASLQALQPIRYFFSEGRTVPIGKVVTVVEVPEGGTFQVFWKYGPQTHLTVPKEDIGRLAILLDSPLAMCHAARWLAMRLGCDPGVTAPMWFPEEGDWTMREWIMPVLGGRLVFNETGWCGNHDAIPCQKVRGISRVTDPAAALAAACLAVGGAS